MAELQGAMDDFLHGGQVSDMTEEINILKKKVRELEGKSTGSSDDLVHVDSVAVTIAGVAETNILSHSLTLDSDDVIHAIIESVFTDNPTGGVITLRVYADAVLIATATSNGARGDTNDVVCTIGISIIGTGVGTQRILVNEFQRAPNPGPYLYAFQLAVNVTSAIDWTTAKTLNVTVQLSNALLNFRKYAAWIRNMAV